MIRSIRIDSFVEEMAKTFDSLEQQINIPIESIKNKSYVMAIDQLIVIKDKLRIFKLLSVNELTSIIDDLLEQS